MLNILIFGGPGSGKGTQSDLITEKYNLKHISTGEFLRKEIAKGSELGVIADSYISKGQLVPDDLMIDMMEGLIKEPHSFNGFIFDGYPRTVTQGIALDNKMAKNGMKISTVLCLDVDEEILAERLINRGKYSGRSDDNKKTIQRRLEVYHEETEPLIEYYQKQNKLSRIEGNGNIEEVFANITVVLNEKIEK